jgi:hypothetical protein
MVIDASCRTQRDMALLDDAIDACGGLARWNNLSRFTLHLSVGGTLFSDAGHAREFKDVTAEGSTRTQAVRFTGITGGEHSGVFQPEAITIESLDGEVLRTWHDPSFAFPDTGAHALADELHLVFFCGVAIWNYLTTPFLLAHPDVVVICRPCRTMRKPGGVFARNSRRASPRSRPSRSSISTRMPCSGGPITISWERGSRSIRGRMTVLAGSWCRRFAASRRSGLMER